jgi:hypothetical protein
MNGSVKGLFCSKQRFSLTPKKRKITGKTKPSEYSREFWENAIRLTNMRGRKVACAVVELKISA